MRESFEKDMLESIESMALVTEPRPTGFMSPMKDQLAKFLNKPPTENSKT